MDLLGVLRLGCQLGVGLFGLGRGLVTVLCIVVERVHQLTEFLEVYWVNKKLQSVIFLDLLIVYLRPRRRLATVAWHSFDVSKRLFIQVPCAEDRPSQISYTWMILDNLLKKHGCKLRVMYLDDVSHHSHIWFHFRVRGLLALRVINYFEIILHFYRSLLDHYFWDRAPEPHD